MQLAKLTAKGQITLSPETRKKLGVRGGDKVILLEQEDGFLIRNSDLIANKNLAALKQWQDDMAGVAERLGLKDEDDVVEMIHAVRRGE
jgi:bifunctional DNA-binding transcriptional regulator/antitoxin component of YhaV-PrlF toxin-antitoxin module